MSLLSIIVFGHVLGMSGFFVALGLEGAAISRRLPELEAPRLYRSSVALLVVTGGLLTRGLVEGTSESTVALSWLVVSVAALAIVAATGLLPAARRARIYTVRAALTTGIVYLMVAQPPLAAAIVTVLVAIVAGIVASVLLGSATIVVGAAVDR